MVNLFANMYVVLRLVVQCLGKSPKLRSPGLYLLFLGGRCEEYCCMKFLGRVFCSCAFVRLLKDERYQAF